MNKPTHRYDEIRGMPTAMQNISQTCYRSHHILQEVKRMLAEFYNSDAILDIIALLETDLPNQNATESDLEFARRNHRYDAQNYIIGGDK